MMHYVMAAVEVQDISLKMALRYRALGTSLMTHLLSETPVVMALFRRALRVYS